MALNVKYSMWIMKGIMVGCCEHGNVFSIYVKAGNFLIRWDFWVFK